MRGAAIRAGRAQAQRRCVARLAAGQARRLAATRSRWRRCQSAAVWVVAEGAALVMRALSPSRSVGPKVQPRVGDASPTPRSNPTDASLAQEPASSWFAAARNTCRRRAPRGGRLIAATAARGVRASAAPRSSAASCGTRRGRRDVCNGDRRGCGTRRVLRRAGLGDERRHGGAVGVARRPGRGGNASPAASSAAARVARARRRPAPAARSAARVGAVWTERPPGPRSRSRSRP